MIVTGGQLVEQARRFDAGLQKLEEVARTRIDAALKASTAKLEQDVKRYYNEARVAGATESAVYREARARALLAQTDSLTLATRAVAAPYDNSMGLMVRDAWAAGAQDASKLLSMHGLEALGMHATIPEGAVLAATNASARLAHRGVVFAQAAESAVIGGLLRGQAWSHTARELRATTGILRYEAERIIVTESVRASDQGRQDTYAANGVEHVQFLSTLDDRLCGYCAYRSGVVYVMGDVEAPLHPFCRCLLLPWRKEWQEDGLTDDAWFSEHRTSSLERTEDRPRRGASPAERWKGLTRAPTPVWIPPRPAGWINPNPIPRTRAPQPPEDSGAPPPPPAATQQPVWPDKASGRTPTRASAAFDTPRATATNTEKGWHQDVTELLGIMDEVHRAPVMRSMRVRMVTTKPRANGSINYGTYRAEVDKPGGITIAVNGPHRMMTMAHEAGHAFDHLAFGRLGYHQVSPGRYAPTFYTDTKPAALEAWKKAVKNSDSVKRIRARTYTVGEATYELPRGTVNYLLDESELFARSYAQYIAKKSGSPRMMAELDGIRGSLNPVRTLTQWSDKDFEPIMQAFDEFFKEQGWLPTNQP